MARPPSALVRGLLPVGLALLCAAGPRAQTGAKSEKDLLAAFKEGFANAEPSARAAAVAALGDGSRALPDKGAGKRVAQALVKALADPELDVGAAAVQELARGRDVDTTLAGFDAFLRDTARALEKRLGATDKDGRDFVGRGTVLFENACFALGNYRDERALAPLLALLGGLRPDTKKSDLGSRLIGGLAVGALELGSLPALEAVVAQTDAFDAKTQEAGARKLHAALSEFATRTKTTGPEWSENYAKDWRAWLEANRGAFPAKLGRLASPPADWPPHPLNGLPGKSA